MKGSCRTVFEFRELRREDLPILSSWRSSEHVARWWGEPADLETEYFGTADPVDYFVALRDGRPIGLVQHYRWADFPGEAESIGATADEISIDYFLGDANLIGAGLGPAMLEAFLDQVVRPGSARGVRLDVAEANRRSWRCLEKLGFRREQEGVLVEGEPGPHYVYALGLPGRAQQP
ncbi:MAG TPA: GNAT family N-acetyltransferase [Solirubrobacteraceae bacterium]|nr:GNAT family N-acetyltransferase [Solirubrobacteraceae bacterium]